MFKNIGKIFRALKQGESLTHASRWKNVQATTTALTAVLAAVILLVPNLGLTDADIQALASGIAIIGGVISSYLTYATSRKVGLTVDAEQLPAIYSAADVPVPTTIKSDSGAQRIPGH